MKRLLYLIIPLSLFIVLPSMAQDPAPPSAVEQPATPPSVPSTMAAPTTPAPEATATNEASEEKDATVGEVIGDAANVYDKWKTLGWLAGLIALVNLLINVMRVRLVKDWLYADEKRKRIVPFVAAGLGALLAGLSVFQTGAGIAESLVAGVMAGFAAVGAHEAFKAKKPKEEAST